MKKIMVVSIGACCILGMTGCTQPNMSDSTRTKTEGAVSGAVAGAVLGGLIGGRDGAALGAAVGGATGLAVGHHIANKKAQYARTEDWLDASIAHAAKVNRSMHAYNNKLAKEIAKTKRLTRLYKEKKISKSTLIAQQRTLKNQKSEAKKRLALIEEELKAQRRVLRDPDTNKSQPEKRKLANEVKKMEQEKKTLSRQSRTIANMSVMSAV